MSTETVVGFNLIYLGMNVSLIVGYVIFSFAKKARRGHARNLLRTGYLVVAAAIFFPAAIPIIPDGRIYRPPAQILSRVRHGEKGDEAVFTGVTRSQWLSDRQTSNRVTFNRFYLLGLTGILVAGFFLRLLVLICGAIRLRRQLSRTFNVKNIGRVTICLGDASGAPFACWMFRRAYIVIPEAFIVDGRSANLAVRHELQHLRYRDPQLAWALEIFRAFFFANPAAYCWFRALVQLQEFACDEAIVSRRRATPHAYAECLISAAKLAVASRATPVGTTGMATESSAETLKRRIEMLFEYSKIVRPRRYLGWRVGTTAALFFVACAGRMVVNEKQMTMDEGLALAAKTQSTSQIPVSMNPMVLRKLNEIVSTPAGKKFFKDALGRMPEYRATIERKISEYGLPPELIAIPLFESGFRNEVVSPDAGARGIWQFIATTARRYKLVVDPDRKDERIDVEKETDAAMRYLRDLHGIFHDWRLAIKAYNEGENYVQKLIDREGTRDPWELEKRDEKGGYLTGTMAAIIVSKNPDLL